MASSIRLQKASRGTLAGLTGGRGDDGALPLRLLPAAARAAAPSSTSADGGGGMKKDDAADTLDSWCRNLLRGGGARAARTAMRADVSRSARTCVVDSPGWVGGC
jgi:hypothetical protein